MSKRKKLSRGGSSSLFAATANKANLLNNPKMKPQRGGTRL